MFQLLKLDFTRLQKKKFFFPLATTIIPNRKMIAFLDTSITLRKQVYYGLNLELRREKDQMGRDGFEGFIVDNSSVKCAYSA